jgi:4a-hydroxytetrahydrobiopterin dehydratase
MSLKENKCVACEGDVPTLKPEEYAPFLAELGETWKVVGSKVLCKEFTFANFVEAVDFINQVKDIAENEQHHPDLNLHNYKQVLVTLSTHAIGGLSRNDFIVAAKIDGLTF